MLPFLHSTFRPAQARFFVRVQHGGQEQGMAAGHHVQGGQRKQVLLDFAAATAAVHHLYEASQCVEKVIVSVAIPAEEKHTGGYSLVNKSTLNNPLCTISWFDGC